MRHRIFFTCMLIFILSVQGMADTHLVRHLDVWDIYTYNYNASHWLEQGNLQNGVSMYGEFNIPVKDIPPHLLGSDWIQTSYASKNFSGEKMATFQLKEDAEVYIAHAMTAGTKPEWLRNYRKTGILLHSSLGDTFELLTKKFQKNDMVRLGRNGSPDVAMYFVIIKALQPPVKKLRGPGNWYNVTDFGAKGDGKTLNTKAIQGALDKCSAAGGGTVYVSGGVFVTGTLELGDHTTLWIEEGSILRGSPHKTDYPEKKCLFRYFRADEHFQLIYAERKKDIRITGGGIIDGYSLGDGWPWKGKSNEWERPRLIRMVECKNVQTDHITLVRSANWTQLYEACNDLRVLNVRVRCYTGQHNQDGIDISSCDGVVIKDFYAMTGDDAICIKAMSQKPTENIYVEGVTARYANCHAIKIGTETHGDIRNIHVKNVEANARYGIAIEAVDGSNVDGVTYENFLLTNCSTPLFIRLGDRGRTYAGGPAKAPLGSMKNITIRNIRNTGIRYVEARNGPGVGSAIGGLPDRKIENLTIENCSFLYYGTIQDTSFVYQDVPENRDKYPEFNIYGTCPAFGLYFRHIDGLKIQDVSVRVKHTDIRPAIVLDDVEQYRLSRIRTEKFPGTVPFPIWSKQSGELFPGE
jgi:polygalacturonase